MSSFGHTRPSFLTSKLQIAPCKPLSQAIQVRNARLTPVRAQKLEEESQRRQTDATQNEAGGQCTTEEDFYPQYEEEEGAKELFPRRQPGAFPNIKVSRSGLQAALTRLQTLAAAPPAEVGGTAEAAFDPLRDGPLRYLGYANECGEAFAAWLPLWGVPFSYAVAIGYVLTDTADKGSKAFRASQQELGANQELHPDVDMLRLVSLLSFERVLDTAVWQLLASVACPGYTIHTVVALVHGLLKPLEGTSAAQQLAGNAAVALHLHAADVLAVADKSVPTALGLAAIPFIVQPIDNAIHAVMNMTLRPAMRKYVCSSGQGSLAGLQMCGEEECIPPGVASNGSQQNGSS